MSRPLLVPSLRTTERATTRSPKPKRGGEAISIRSSSRLMSAMGVAPLVRGDSLGGQGQALAGGHADLGVVVVQQGPQSGGGGTLGHFPAHAPVGVAQQPGP